MICFTVCASSQKKGYKDRCLWSLSKSSSRNRDTIVNITSLDLVEENGNGIQDKPFKLDEQEKKESNSPLKSIPSELHSSKEASETELIAQEETHWQSERAASTKIQTAFRCYLVCSASLSMAFFLFRFRVYGLGFMHVLHVFIYWSI